MSALEVVALAKSFAGRTIFSNAHLSLAPGTAVAVTGPSGVGKTTFLRCCNGLEHADGGAVIVGETRLVAGDSAPARQIAIAAVRARVGFVFQGNHLFSHRTALENVMEGPRFVQGVPVATAKARAEALLDKVGLAHRAHAYPRELSGGEQQRTAIARALALDPQVLLLDEPTSALDAARGEDLAALLRDLVREGRAILTVTHDAAFARALDARVLRLHTEGFEET